MGPSGTNFFDFGDDVRKRLRSARSFEEQLIARTSVGQEQFGPRPSKAGLVGLREGDNLHLGRFPHVLVSGVATYSNPEMDILGQCSEALRQRPQTFIVDIDFISTVEEIHERIPFAPIFIKTPVVAEYEGGMLKNFSEGLSAVERMKQFVVDQNPL